MLLGGAELLDIEIFHIKDHVVRQLPTLPIHVWHEGMLLEVCIFLSYLDPSHT